MAKSWSGFTPQNQTVKEQWHVLEASRNEISEMLRMVLEERTPADPAEEDELPALPRTH